MAQREAVEWAGGQDLAVQHVPRLVVAQSDVAPALEVLSEAAPALDEGLTVRGVDPAPGTACVAVHLGPRLGCLHDALVPVGRATARLAVDGVQVALAHEIGPLGIRHAAYRVPADVADLATTRRDAASPALGFQLLVASEGRTPL